MRTGIAVGCGRLDGKNVIVTGAGREIGQPIALRFAAEGADFLIMGRTLSPLEATARLCILETLPT